MLDFAYNAAAFVVAIGVLVSVHEFGHFWVARRLGFKVLRFSIGFGKPLVRWQGRGPDYTEYWLSAVPLGGYVKMLDEREAPVAEAESHRAFNRRPVWQRTLVLLAGPGFNFLFAIVAYWAMFVTGVPGMRPVIGAVEPGSLAAQAGLVPDDEIEAVDGRSAGTWEHATLELFDALLSGGRIDLSVRDPSGDLRHVALDVRGHESELTEPDALFPGLGIRPGAPLPPVIESVTEGSPAQQAGLKGGDRVVSAAGEQIRSWEQWVGFVRARPGQTVQVKIARGGDELTLPLAIGTVTEKDKTFGRIGATPRVELPPAVVERLRAETRYGVFEALPRAAQKTWEMTALTVRMLVHMVTGEVSIRNVSGPLTIAAYAGESAHAGSSAFLSFLAVVSLSLGILNLLPVPLLDGGQIAYQLAEGLKGSPLSERAMAVGQQVGVFFLIVLMSFVFYNDLSRIFGS
jgi:regulator of sigma E protease